MSPLRVGLIGLGKAGVRHAAAVRRSGDGQLVAAADPAEAGARSAAELGIPCHTRYEELLARPDIDAVIISLPHGMLAAAAVAAARSGKHLLLEKPMGISLAEAEEVAAACRKAGVRLMVNFVHRFRAEYRQAREVLSSGIIGKPVMLIDIMASGRGDLPAWTWRPELSGGGMMMYNGIHSIDRLHWLAGSPITQVTAVMGNYSYGQALEDNLAGTLRFASGALGSVVQHKSDATATLNAWQTMVYGTRGALKVLTGGGLEVVSEKERFSLQVGEDDRFLGAFSEFAAAVREGRDPSPGAADGIHALTAVLALYRAVESTGAVEL